jgi:hypothetical protein
MALTAQSSELDAVNIILASIGATPISNLSAITAADAQMALGTLNEISRAVQSKGWRFNTEISFTLPPTAPSQEIYIPGNCVRVEAVDADANRDIIQRGNRLYDRVLQTFSFDKPVTVEMVLLLPFGEIPETARRYITIRAARVMQERSIGSEILYKFNALDEQEAHREFRRGESIVANYNILSGSHSVSRTLKR